jgi:hypothetical protein
VEVSQIQKNYFQNGIEVSLQKIQIKTKQKNSNQKPNNIGLNKH